MSVILNVQVISIGIVQMVSTRVPGISDENRTTTKQMEKKNNMLRTSEKPGVLEVKLVFEVLQTYSKL